MGVRAAHPLADEPSLGLGFWLVVGEGDMPGRHCSIEPASGTRSTHVRRQPAPVNVVETHHRYDARERPNFSDLIGTAIETLFPFLRRR
ncbi:MAG: hypothetical protein ACRDHI_13080, partial [Actinomycetota bacterium]